MCDHHSASPSGDIYWVGQKVSLVYFRKIKDTFTIFTNNFIDLDILSMSAIPYGRMLIV